MRTKQESLDLFLASENRRMLMEEIRDIAYGIAKEHGTVTVDMVRKRFALPTNVDGRIYGAVFASRDFEPIGYTQTKVKSSHGRPVRVFRLRTA